MTTVAVTTVVVTVVVTCGGDVGGTSRPAAGRDFSANKTGAATATRHRPREFCANSNRKTRDTTLVGDGGHDTLGHGIFSAVSRSVRVGSAKNCATR